MIHRLLHHGSSSLWRQSPSLQGTNRIRQLRDHVKKQGRQEAERSWQPQSIPTWKGNERHVASYTGRHKMYTCNVLFKIATLSRGEQPGSLVDRVFRVSLSEFHTSLISSYSLKLQVSSCYHASEEEFYYALALHATMEPRGIIDAPHPPILSWNIWFVVAYSLACTSLAKTLLMDIVHPAIIGYCMQNSMECSTDSYREKASWPEKPRVYITFSQLVDNFSSIFRGIAHHEGLNDPCYIAVGINHIKTLLDEFSKAR